MASQERVLLMGFGDIARRLSTKLNKSFEIYGVRRGAGTHPDVKLTQADCASSKDMSALLSSNPFDVVVMTMTPDDISDEGYQRAYVKPVEVLLNVLKQQQYQPRLILFVSSTSVYGQQNAEWVDETSVTEPGSFSGKRLLEAETLLSESAFTTCCVRFSGIYGPGRRRLIDQVINGHGASKSPVLYSNRIHADDCAGVLQHLIEKQEPLAPVYLATDCEPSPLYEVKLWLAEQLGLPAEHLQPKPVNRILRSSKRCSNDRLLASGYQFSYPTFREGYRSVLDEMEKIP